MEQTVHSLDTTNYINLTCSIVESIFSKLTGLLQRNPIDYVMRGLQVSPSILYIFPNIVRNPLSNQSKIYERVA